MRAMCLAAAGLMMVSLACNTRALIGGGGDQGGSKSGDEDTANTGGKGKKDDPSNGDPSNGDPSNGDPSNGDPSNGDPSNGDPSNGDPSNGGPSNGGPSNGDPSNGDPSNGDPSNGDPSNGDPNDDDGDITLDQVPPDLVSVVATSHTVIIIEFSEGLSVESIDTTSFTIQGPDGGLEVQEASLLGDGLRVELTIADGAQHGQTYMLLIHGIADAQGNVASNLTHTFTGRGQVVAEVSNAPGSVTSASSFQLGVGGTDIVSYRYGIASPSEPLVWSTETEITTEITLEGLEEGTYTLKVVGKDSLGNWQSMAEPTVVQWTVDTTPPTVTFVSGPFNVTSDDEATLVLGGEGVVAYRYRLVGEPWSDVRPISDPIFLDALVEDEYHLEAVGQDAAGNWQEDNKATAYSWTVHFSAGIAMLSNLPKNPSNQSSIAVTVGGPGVVAYRYALNNGPLGDERAIDDLIEEELTEGTHTLTVLGLDLSGAWQDESTPTVYTWVVDLTPPDPPQLSNTPADLTNETTTSIGVSGAGITHYRYRRNGGDWSGKFVASAPLALSNLGEGTHTLEIVGIDEAGNEDLLNPASFTWEIDITPPNQAVVEAPPSPTNLESMELLVQGTDEHGAEVVAYQYRLGDGGWSAETPIDTPLELTDADLAEEREYHLQVIVKDPAGNWQAQPTTHTFVIDRTPPTATLGGLPALVTSADWLEVTVEGDEVVTYAYRLDEDDWSELLPSSVSIEAQDLAEGSHTLAVVACDAAGNCQDDAEATVHTWTVMLTAPTAWLANTPAHPTNLIAASVTVEGTNVAEYAYRLDGGGWSAWQDVGSPIELDNLDEGSHTLEVRGRDIVGNAQEADDATTWTWTVDTTPPVAVLTNLPPTLGNQAQATITVQGDQVVEYRYRLNGDAFSVALDATTPILLENLPDDTYVLEVIARDAAGSWQDTSDPTTHTFTVDTQAPVPPSVMDHVGSVDDAGVVTEQLLLTFSWNAPEDAVEQRLQVATDAAFDHVVWGGTTGGLVSGLESHTYIATPAHGGRYYARLRVRDAAGNWSSFGPSSDGIDIVGSIRGKVRNTSTQNIQGASVTLQWMDNTFISSTTSNSSGDFFFQHVPIGTNAYEVQVAKSGYHSATKGNITVTVGATTDIGLVYLVSTSASSGRISGTVVDANDGSAISNVTVAVIDWSGTEVTTATTNGDGNFTTPLPALTPGTYTLRLSATGYFTLEVDNVSVDGNRSVGRQALCEILAEPQVRVVLLWGSSPTDLDLHLVGPTAKTLADSPKNRFYIYWNRESYNENTGNYSTTSDPTGTAFTASLVQDDVTGYGPETINLFGVGNGYANGVYTYTVHKYSSGGSWYDQPVTMRVYDSQGMVREIPLPSGAGSKRYWQALKLDIQGASRAQRTVNVVNSFANLTYGSKSSMNW